MYVDDRSIRIGPGARGDPTLRGLSANATIDHAVFEHAEEGIDVTSRGGTVTLYQVTTQNNEVGLQVTGSGGAAAAAIVDASDSWFVYNSVWGVHVLGGGPAPYPAVTIQDSYLYANGGPHDLVFTMDQPHEAVVLARNNYWGTVDPAMIEARTSGKVDWCGWRDSPGGPPVRDTYCPDLVICDETQDWTGTVRPYLLVDDVWVCPTGTLNIASGVETLWRRGDDPDPDERAELRVQGVLDISGPPNATFEPDASAPQPGDWGGIRIEYGAAANIDFALVRYAEYGLISQATSTINHAYFDHSLMHGIHVTSGTTTLEGVNTRYNGGNGLDVLKLSSAMSISATSCVFASNDGYGVRVRQHDSSLLAPEVTINDSSIRDNLGGYQVFADSGFPESPETVLDFRNNWWGTTVHEDIETAIRDHQDASDAAHVDWCGYLSAFPPSTPVNDAHCPDLVVCDGTKSWLQTDKPYLLWEEVKVCPTGTLEIGPGVEVRSTGPRLLAIGTLNVNGTVPSPVTFTSDSSTPAPDDWEGLEFVADSTSTVENATITYAEHGISIFDHAQVVLRNVAARQNRIGLLLDNTAAPPPSLLAEGCAFTNNQQEGLWFTRASLGAPPSLDVTVTDSEIHSNSGSVDLRVGAVFQNADELVINAQGNWWGTTSATTISSRIYDHADSGYAATVNWCDYLSSAGGTPERAGVCTSPVICDADVTWDRTDLPYLFTTDVYVCPTGVLHVGPGVEVRMVATWPELEIRVDGILDVNGTPGAPVSFTSDADAPQIGDWQGLIFHGDGTRTIPLEHASIRFAERGMDVGASAHVTLEGVTAQDNQTGLFVYGAGQQTVAANACSFVDNDSYGVYLRRYPGQPNPDVT
jgi:hypothetical protein